MKRASHEVSNVPNRSHRPVQHRIELSIFMHLNSSSSLQGRFTCLHMLILHTCAGKMSPENEPGNEKEIHSHTPKVSENEIYRHGIGACVEFIPIRSRPWQTGPGCSFFFIARPAPSAVGKVVSGVAFASLPVKPRPPGSATQFVA